MRGLAVTILLTTAWFIPSHGTDQVLPLDQETVIDVQGRERLLIEIDLGQTDESEAWSLTETIVIQSRLKRDNVTLHLAAVHGGQSRSWTMLDAQPSSVTLCLDREDETGKKPAVSLVVHNPGYQSQTEPTPLSLEAKPLNISMTVDQTFQATVSETRPVTHLVRYSSHPDSRIGDQLYLVVEDDGGTPEVCMVVTAYRQKCPLKDQPDNFDSAQMFAHGLQNVAMTLPTSNKFGFNEPFFVSVMVLPNDRPCHVLSQKFGDRSRYDDDHDHGGPAAVAETGKRSKNVTLRLSKLPGYERYWTPVMIYFLGILAVCVTGVIAVWGISYEEPEATEEASEAEGSGEKMNGNGAAAATVDAVDGVDSVVHVMPDIGDEEKYAGEDGREKLKRDWSAYRKNQRQMKDLKLRIGLLRMNQSATLADMTRLTTNDVWFRRNRSRVYLFLVPLISVYYIIPGLQFVWLTKNTEEMTGSMDFCFHNFRCSKPWYIFSDFNHVVSNVSYLIFGAVFVVLVYWKKMKLPAAHQPKFDHNAKEGIMQQLSIFYAMGFALFAQFFFSICYHVCPTNLSLQFDLTMMYVMCILGYMKIYQFRHPDATISAYATFAGLAALVFLEVFLLYSTSVWPFLFFIVFYVLLTLAWFLDQYYLGVGRLSWKIFWAILQDFFLRLLKRETDLEYTERARFAWIFLWGNLSYAGIMVFRRFVTFKSSVSHEVLYILAGNLLIYMVYYVVVKSIKEAKGETRCQMVKSCCCDVCRHKFKMGSLTLRCPLSTGSFFTVMAIVLFGVALGFYRGRNANRNLSPAESRNLNAECGYMDFFDNHDLWHFFSGAGIFMAFLALLVVDDNLMFTPRNEIPVI